MDKKRDVKALRTLGNRLNHLMRSIEEMEFGTYGLNELDDKTIDNLYLLDCMTSWQESVNRGLRIHDKKSETLSLDVYDIEKINKVLREFKIL